LVKSGGWDRGSKSSEEGSLNGRSPPTLLVLKATEIGWSTAGLVLFMIPLRYTIGGDSIPSGFSNHEKVSEPVMHLELLTGVIESSGNIDIWMVRSPDDDSLEEGEYVRPGVGGLGLESVLIFSVKREFVNVAAETRG
jgi:hypothetical protein